MRNIVILLLLTICVTGMTQSIECVITNNRSLTVRWEGKDRLSGGIPFFKNAGNTTKVMLLSKEKQGVAILTLVVKESFDLKANEYAAVVFDSIQNYKHGVALWRYKPWNSWTKPMKISSYSALPDWDVQFYYWQYDDGTYGAMVPMSGEGYRTTLGKENDGWGSKAMAYTAHQPKDVIPAMAIAFGSDPYELFKKIYRVTLEYMGKDDNLQVKKTFPEPLQYLGWCTWNSSDLGKNLNEGLLFKAAKSFQDNKFPLGWILIDDGWFQHAGSKLQSMKPDQQKFPQGFKPVVDKLKKDYGVKYIGIWHALDGYWNGIDPSSPVGKQYQKELFSWTQKESVDKEDSPQKTYYFIKPESDSLRAFYETWHKYFKSQGIDFIKVDNQLVTERMAVNNYPLFNLSQAMHKALNASTAKYFNNAIINCMDMTAEAYFNFGSTPVARAVEDFFPYETNENYNLERGNAAAHVLQAMYNSIYFSQMAFPDFDMFQSHNPNATFHAIARAINNGPVYITDNLGEQNFSVLRPLVYADGKIVKSETSLLPTEDCLFQVQDAQLFKGYSRVGNAGLLGVWNAADAALVKGTIAVKDVKGIAGNEFVLYEYFSKTVKTVTKDEILDVELPRLGYKLFYVVPVENNFAPFGLINKYNAPATILSVDKRTNEIQLSLYEGGSFKAYAKNKPKRMAINGLPFTAFSFVNNVLSIEVPFTKSGTHPKVSIYW